MKRMMSSMLSIQDVSFVYQGREGAHVAVSQVNLEVKEGEFIAFIGPSGCGKSTLLNMLAGLLEPTEGQILYKQKKIMGPSLERGVVFQNYSLFPWMTAQDNILLALKQVESENSRQALVKRAKELLAMVGLNGAEHKFPNQLSGGMQQRVALARLFALDSPVFLMDEPFGAVDAAVRSNLQQCLIDLWEQEEEAKTVVLVTHDIDEAILLADRIVVFTPGPGRIKEIIPVHISRPREKNSLFQSSRYLELRAHILALLHQEEKQKEDVYHFAEVVS